MPRQLSVQPFINQINSCARLRDAEKENAITGLLRIEYNLGANFYSSAEILAEAFLWERTIEGKEFWFKINNKIYEIDTQ